MTDLSATLPYQLNDAAEEAYKVLRANIQFYQSNEKIQTLSILSYRPGEGKSTTSIYLGISMAKSGLKVLYVDADLRKPLAYKFLPSNNSIGLSNYLMKQSNLEGITNTSNIKNFHFINSGFNIPNPWELITPNHFEAFFTEAKPLYDMIIIDTPPLGSVIDGAIIAKQTDGTIIIMESNSIRRRDASMMKEQLLKANANIIGVVLNKINRSDYKEYYRSYNYYGSKK